MGWFNFNKFNGDTSLVIQVRLIIVFVTCKAETPSPSVASLESVWLNNRTSSRSAERPGQCRAEKTIKVTRYLLGCINSETAIVSRSSSSKRDSCMCFQRQSQFRMKLPCIIPSYWVVLRWRYRPRSFSFPVAWLWTHFCLHLSNLQSDHIYMYVTCKQQKNITIGTDSSCCNKGI